MLEFRVTSRADEVNPDELWHVYDAVFHDYPSYEAWREAVWDKHSAREGFRFSCARVGGSLVGFAYGYTGEDGQWWTDNARKVLPKEVADTWLGGHFEVVSIGVAEQARRGGMGRRLMQLLCDGVPQDRLLLMTTANTSDPARCLYEADGWSVLGDGIGSQTVIMGLNSRTN